METVLVIPVLFTILGGVMWLGQLQVNSARLPVADRYVAWNLINRHRQDVAATALREELQESEPRIFYDAPDIVEQRERLLDGDQNIAPAANFWRWSRVSMAMEVAAPGPVSALYGVSMTMGPAAAPAGKLRFDDFRSRNPHFVLGRATIVDGSYTGSRFNRGTPVHCDETLFIDWDAVFEEAWFE